MEKICLNCQKEFDQTINFCLECGKPLLEKAELTEKIFNCNFEYKCPLEWNNLDKTADEDVRFCHSCEKNVYFVHLQHQLDDLARQGKCVAFQPRRNLKFFGANTAPPPLMGAVVSPERMAELRKEKEKEESGQTAKNVFAAPDKTKPWWKFWK